MLQRKQLVMLPSQQATIGVHIIIKHEHDNSLHYGKKIQEDYNMLSIPQHLYIVDDSEIKEDDWCYNEVDKYVYQPTGIDFVNACNYVWKVIATTNPELWYTDEQLVGYKQYDYMRSTIAKIDQDFIQAYIREYNTGNIITEVMVEYIDTADIDPNVEYNEVILKLKRDNSIIIHKVKENPFDKLLVLAEQMLARITKYRFTSKSMEEAERWGLQETGMLAIIQLIKRQSNE